MSEQLFVYGTLKDPDIQRNVIGRVVPATVGVLEGYLLGAVTTDKATYPALVKEHGAREISGLVLEIEKDDLIPLDIYESEESTGRKLYDRVVERIKDGREVWLYVKKDG
jgi:gamma-glutamylcyclotransferase (GGCT)/AIG2-like uncharacterized protein YtfP